MRNTLALSFIAAIGLSPTTYALNPVEGLYLGFIAGGNYMPKVDLAYPYTNNILIPYGTRGSLSYDFGGNIGGELGYKINNYRLEAEFNYNYLGFDQVTFNGIVIKNKKIKNSIKLGGNTTMMTAFFNGYYDFLSPNAESGFVPYVGLGIGIAKVKNSADFTYNSQIIVKTSNSKNSGALQGILGFSYYLDDFTRFSLDYRYFTTNNSDASDFFDQRLNMSSINLTFNFALAS